MAVAAAEIVPRRLDGDAEVEAVNTAEAEGIAEAEAEPDDEGEGFVETVATEDRVELGEPLSVEVPDSDTRAECEG